MSGLASATTNVVEMGAAHGSKKRINKGEAWMAPSSNLKESDDTSGYKTRNFAIVGAGRLGNFVIRQFLKEKNHLLPLTCAGILILVEHPSATMPQAALRRGVG